MWCIEQEIKSLFVQKKMVGEKRAANKRREGKVQQRADTDLPFIRQENCVLVKGHRLILGEIKCPNDVYTDCFFNIFILFNDMSCCAVRNERLIWATSGLCVKWFTCLKVWHYLVKKKKTPLTSQFLQQTPTFSLVLFLRQKGRHFFLTETASRVSKPSLIKGVDSKSPALKMTPHFGMCVCVSMFNRELFNGGGLVFTGRRYPCFDTVKSGFTVVLMSSLIKFKASGGNGQQKWPIIKKPLKTNRKSLWVCVEVKTKGRFILHDLDQKSGLVPK